MTQIPPPNTQAQMPLIPAAMIDAPTPQSLAWEKGVAPDGTVVAQLRVMWPHVSVLILLQEQDGMRLADGLREIFGGLQIARLVPPSNGQGPTGAVGP